MKSERVEGGQNRVRSASDGCARILIVEDEPAVLALFHRYLAEDGYHVTALRTYRQALAAAQETTFDVLVMDLSLPDIDGIEAIRNFSADFPWAKILAISGYMAGSVPGLAVGAGATATLAKPATGWGLRRAVYRILDPAGKWHSGASNAEGSAYAVAGMAASPGCGVNGKGRESHLRAAETQLAGAEASPV